MLLSLIQCQTPQPFTIPTGINSANTTRINFTIITNTTLIPSNTTIQNNIANNAIIIIGNIVLVLPVFFLSYLY